MKLHDMEANEVIAETITTILANGGLSDDDRREIFICVQSVFCFACGKRHPTIGRCGCVIDDDDVQTVGGQCGG